MIRIYRDAPTKVELIKSAKLIESKIKECSPLMQEQLKKAIEALKVDKFGEAAKYMKQVGAGGKTGNAAKVAKAKTLAKALIDRIASDLNMINLVSW